MFLRKIIGIIAVEWRRREENLLESLTERLVLLFKLLAFCIHGSLFRFQALILDMADLILVNFNDSRKDRLLMKRTLLVNRLGSFKVRMVYLALKLFPLVEKTDSVFHHIYTLLGLSPRGFINIL